MPIPRHIQTRLLLVVAVVATAGAVWIAATLESGAIDRTFKESRAAQQMLAAMLDQETGVRGFALTDDQRFLAPYLRGIDDFNEAVGTARSWSGEDRGEARRLVLDQVAVAAQWRTLAEQSIASTRRQGSGIGRRGALRRKALMDRFRALNSSFQSRIDTWDHRERQEANRLLALVVVLFASAFGGIGYLLLSRGARAERDRREEERRYQAGQAEFAETLQVASSEEEANDVLKVHLERAIPDSSVVVLKRNNSADRLQPATAVPEGSPLTVALESAVPQSCLAVRLGRPYERGADAEPLLACQVCGKLAGDSTCKPLLVSGEVIGSVLVERPGPLPEAGVRRLRESISLAGPMLANLRNLAIAEQRAATDPLTGLANKRTVEDTLKRMVAQAGRTATPLAAVLVDLDHFKQINDTYGHDRGDEALAAVGATMMDALRASDFVGRYGGEEFILLLPATGLEGAVHAAEKLRRTIAAQAIPGVSRHITASMGVAVLPDHAVEGDQLLRMADRALYAAKHAGRNRVEVAGETHGPAEPSPPAAAPPRPRLVGPRRRGE